MLIDHVALLASILVLDFAASMSPGPNFVLVTQTAVSRPRRQSGAVVAGLATGLFLWSSTVVLGLAVVFELWPWLFGALKAAGGVYLVYVGIRLWRHAGDSPVAAPGSGPSAMSSYGRGLLTALTNPKEAVYFGSIFVAFLGTSLPTWVRVAAIGIVVLNTVAWYGSVALMFSLPVIQGRYVGFRRAIDRAAGCVIIAFGVAVLTHLRDR